MVAASLASVVAAPDPGPRRISIVREVDVAVARLVCRELAEAAGLGAIERHSAVISVSELAMNLVVHARGGSITLGLVTRADGCRGLEVVATDQGGGIEDVERALEDGYSTGAGLGCGLPGVRRLMSELSIRSSVGVGTTVRAVRWARPAASESE